MSRVYDKPVVIQKLSDNGEWVKQWRLLASVNKTGGGEVHESGARRSSHSLTFDVRYFSALFDIFLNTQNYRIIYRGAVFNIEDYDDFMEKHISVRLEGECSGERYES